MGRGISASHGSTIPGLRIIEVLETGHDHFNCSLSSCKKKIPSAHFFTWAKLRKAVICLVDGDVLAFCSKECTQAAELQKGFYIPNQEDATAA